MCRGHTSFGFFRRARNISSLHVSQSCCTQHGSNQYLHGMSHRDSIVHYILPFQIISYRPGHNCFSARARLVPPRVQTGTSVSSWNLAPQATGCKHSDRFHQPAHRCNVTGITLGARLKCDQLRTSSTIQSNKPP